MRTKQARIAELERQIAEIKAESEDIYTFDDFNVIRKNGTDMTIPEVVEELNNYHNQLKPKRIKWDGGDCPVGDNVVVSVRYRNGDIKENIARVYGWAHGGNGTDIIEYTVIEDK